MDIIVLYDQAEYERALQAFRRRGCSKWRDGRALEEVLTLQGGDAATAEELFGRDKWQKLVEEQGLTPEEERERLRESLQGTIEAQ